MVEVKPRLLRIVPVRNGSDDLPTSTRRPASVMIVDEGRPGRVLTHARLRAEYPGQRTASDWLFDKGYEPVTGSDGLWVRSKEPLADRLAFPALLAAFAGVVAFAAWAGLNWGPG